MPSDITPKQNSFTQNQLCALLCFCNNNGTPKESLYLRMSNSLDILNYAFTVDGP